MIKKILITAENYYPKHSGVSQYLRYLSRNLSKRKINVHIMCQSYTGKYYKKKLFGSTVHYSPLLIGSMGEPFKVIEKKNGIAEFIQKLNVDLVYANNHNSLAVIKACKKINLPVIYGFHGVGLLCPLKIRFLKPDNSLCFNERSILNCLECKLKARLKLKHILCRNGITKLFEIIRLVRKYNYAERILDSADARLTNSKYSSKLLRKKERTYGLEQMIETKGKHGYYKVDPTHFKKKYDLDKYILITSRIHNTKGHIYLIEALKYISKNIKLAIVGSNSLWFKDKMDLGYYAKEIRKLINKLNLKDRIVFTGRLNIKEIRQAYSGALCTVVPSIWIETYGNVVPESLACETPVIAPLQGGQAAFLKEEDSFLIVPDKKTKSDPSMLRWSEIYKDTYLVDYSDKVIMDAADQMRLVFDDREKAKEKAKSFRKRMKSQYTWKKTANLVYNRLTELQF